MSLSLYIFMKRIGSRICDETYRRKYIGVGWPAMPRHAGRPDFFCSGAPGAIGSRRRAAGRGPHEK